MTNNYSYLPWFDFFHQILMTVKNLRNIEQYKDSLQDILNCLYNQPPPPPGPFSLDAKSIVRLFILDSERLLINHDWLQFIPIFGLFRTQNVYSRKKSRPH